VAVAIMFCIFPYNPVHPAYFFHDLSSHKLWRQ